MNLISSNHYTNSLAVKNQNCSNFSKNDLAFKGLEKAVSPEVVSKTVSNVSKIAVPAAVALTSLGLMRKQEKDPNKLVEVKHEYKPDKVVEKEIYETGRIVETETFYNEDKKIVREHCSYPELTGPCYRETIYNNFSTSNSKIDEHTYIYDNGKLMKEIYYIPSHVFTVEHNGKVENSYSDEYLTVEKRYDYKTQTREETYIMEDGTKVVKQADKKSPAVVDKCLSSRERAKRLLYNVADGIVKTNNGDFVLEEMQKNPYLARETVTDETGRVIKELDYTEVTYSPVIAPCSLDDRYMEIEVLQPDHSVKLILADMKTKENYEIDTGRDFISKPEIYEKDLVPIEVGDKVFYGRKLDYKPVNGV